MRRYDDPVEVRRGWVSRPEREGQATRTAQGAQGGQEGPEQFLWRERLWKVRVVVAQWVETGPWWLGDDARAAQGELVGAEVGGLVGGLGRTEDSQRMTHLDGLLDEREVWRVEASPGGASDSGGVFDLSFNWNDASWRLVGCVD